MKCTSCGGQGCEWCGGTGEEPDKLRVLSKKAIRKWGAEHQVNIAIEELSECIDALCKHRRCRNTLEDVASEIADIIIITEQLKEMTGRELVSEKLGEKLDRLNKKIKEG